MVPTDDIEQPGNPDGGAQNGAPKDGQPRRQNNNRNRRFRRGQSKTPREQSSDPAPEAKTQANAPSKARPQGNRQRSGQPRQQGKPRTAQNANQAPKADTRQGGNPRMGGNPEHADQPDRADNPPGSGQTLRSRLPRRPEFRRPLDPNRAAGNALGDRRKLEGRRDFKPGGARPATNDFHAPSVPRRVRGGIKARSEDGEFGKNWWAKRWLLAMERLMDGARLQRGRKYARMGQVLTMNEANGGMVARVQGSRPAPYKVTIRVAPLSDEQWDKVYDVLADQAIFAAQLLAGEMPQNIEEAFSAAGVSLFPARGGDLMTECSCPDWVNPCKHIAATHYILGDRFDEDPFLLLRMRGRSQDEILQALRQRRTGVSEPQRVFEPLEPEEEMSDLEADLETFWQIGAELANFEVNVQPPSIPLPILKRLGDADFASKYEFEELLGPAYETISQTALFLAFTDAPGDERENGES